MMPPLNLSASAGPATSGNAVSGTQFGDMSFGGSGAGGGNGMGNSVNLGALLMQNWPILLGALLLWKFRAKLM